MYLRLLEWLLGVAGAVLSTRACFPWSFAHSFPIPWTPPNRDTLPLALALALAQHPAPAGSDTANLTTRMTMTQEDPQPSLETGPEKEENHLIQFSKVPRKTSNCVPVPASSDPPSCLLGTGTKTSSIEYFNNDNHFQNHYHGGSPNVKWLTQTEKFHLKLQWRKSEPITPGRSVDPKDALQNWNSITLRKKNFGSDICNYHISQKIMY